MNAQVGIRMGRHPFWETYIPFLLSISRMADSAVTNIAGLAIVVVLIYFLALSIRRLYLSPIAAFPGPKLAALTFWYEFYYDIVLDRRYTWKIAELHEEYGPIVRINPYELHIHDPAYYDQVFSGSSKGRRVEKWDWQMNNFQLYTAAFGTVGHELHRQRRAALNPFFSKQSVSRLEPTIQEIVDKLRGRLEQLRGSSRPINLFAMYASLSGDVIFNFCFGQSRGLLDGEDFSPGWQEVWKAGEKMTTFNSHFPFVLPILKSLSPTLTVKMDPKMGHILGGRQRLYEQIDAIKAAGAEKARDAERSSIFGELVYGDLPPAEKKTARLADESVVLVGAGTSTTGHTLAVITFHLLDKPLLLQKLQDELRRCRSDVRLRDLKQLTYFSAVVKEGLRVSYGTVHRLARINPDAPMRYQEWLTPAKTPVSMNTWDMHNDLTAFPNPKEYDPERWFVGTEVEMRWREKCWAPFLRGTRQCLGMK